MTEDQEFNEWYKHYPLKKAKLDALKAWKQTKGVRPDTKTLIAAVLTHCRSDQWMRGFIPYPSTWIRQGRWDDEMEVKLPEVVNQKPWHESWPGIQAKGAELGIKEEDFDAPHLFKAAVLRKAMKAA